jgi:Fe-S oxidoreductase
MRNRVPALRWLFEQAFGLSARRKFPTWRRDRFKARPAGGRAGGREVVLFADTFNATFDPEIIDAAVRTLTAGGYRVHVPRATDSSRRPLCCGRTFLSVGKVNSARAEMARSLAAVQPFLERGVPIVGLEPSCLFSFRDELLALLPGDAAKRASAHAFLFEEFIAREAKALRFAPALSPIGEKAVLHGHCHQKAFGAMAATEATLRLIPGLSVDTIDSSCCGMAGAFGYQAETIDISFSMAELSLLPAVRRCSETTFIVADGTSCRQQIQDGTGRKAVHVATLLAASIEASTAAAAGAVRNHAGEGAH